MSTSPQTTPKFGTYLPGLRSMSRGSAAQAQDGYRILPSPDAVDDDASPITQVTPVSRRPSEVEAQAGIRVDPTEIPTMAKEPPALRESGPVESAGHRPRSEGERRPGDVLAGRYRLVKILGEGGMGTVWEAQSMGLDLPVAIKLLHHSIQLPGPGNRLQKEAQATARVVHPAAVRVFDFGTTDDGDPFLVMERLRGTPLSERLRADGPMRPLSAARLLLPVIEALAVAHHEGVIHCDLKPANILLVNGPGGLSPKLIDFGIARIVRRAERRAVTRRGVLLGSPTYMAPEQIRGDIPPDPRVDVWGVCLVLYELCTGRRPFRAVAAEEVIEAILWHELTPPAELRGQGELWSILQRGLQKEPAQRWPNMVMLGRAIAAWVLAQGSDIDVMGTSIAHRWLEGRAPG